MTDAEFYESYGITYEQWEASMNLAQEEHELRLDINEATPPPGAAPYSSTAGRLAHSRARHSRTTAGSQHVECETLEESLFRRWCGDSICGSSG